MKGKNEDAVSPVVGVMLMLVVTIIIAAVVSGFAGGLAGNTQAAPQAAIAVKIDMAGNNNMGGTDTKMTFEHLSGDTIQTKDIQIITYYTNSSGHIYRSTTSPLSERVALYTGSGKLTRVPFINDMRYGYSGNNTAKDFGNYVWSTDDVLSTGTDIGTRALLGIKSDEVDFRQGSVVDVKILHVPSGKYIFDKEVVVL